MKKAHSQTGRTAQSDGLQLSCVYRSLCILCVHECVGQCDMVTLLPLLVSGVNVSEVAGAGYE